MQPNRYGSAHSLVRGGIYHIQEKHLLMDSLGSGAKTRPIVNLSSPGYRIKNPDFLMICPMSSSSQGDGLFDFTIHTNNRNGLDTTESLVTIHLLQLIDINWLEPLPRYAKTITAIDLRRALHKVNTLFPENT